MSEQALKDAKLVELEKQNAQLNQTVHTFACQLRARQQAGQELFEANIHLKASNILLEETVKKFQAENQSFLERVQILEKEKSDLLKEKEGDHKQYDPKLVGKAV